MEPLALLTAAALGFLTACWAGPVVLERLVAWHRARFLPEPVLAVLIVLAGCCVSTLITGHPAGLWQVAALTLVIPLGYYLARDLWRSTQ